MTALIALRFAEYTAGALLFGIPLFLLYARPAGNVPVRILGLVTLSAVALAAAAPIHFLMQTAAIAGTAIDLGTLKAAFLEMDYGGASLARGAAALLALGANILPAGTMRWRAQVVLGVVVGASFSWMGHGAATEGPWGWLHLGANILHVLAAFGWIGALTVFALWLRQETGPRLAALSSFSGFGIGFVGVLTATGIINMVFLVGLSHLPRLWQSLYGQLLSVKIMLFLGMIGLAARNRAVVRTQGADIIRLRRNLWIETGLGLAVLALVSWLGMLVPPASAD